MGPPTILHNFGTELSDFCTVSNAFVLSLFIWKLKLTRNSITTMAIFAKQKCYGENYGHNFTGKYYFVQGRHSEMTFPGC